MWIHHFVILQLFHPKFCMEKDFFFEHKNNDYFFVNSLLMRLKNKQIISMILQGLSGSGWVKTIDVSTEMIDIG
jgi:hypothetical protein